MRIYISGPITGTDNYMEHFQKAEEYLLKFGARCINPAAVLAMMPNDTTYEEYMRMAFTMLKMCDTIYMLKGWNESCGANREYGYAMGSGMTVIQEGNELADKIKPEIIEKDPSAPEPAKPEPLSNKGEESPIPPEKIGGGYQRKTRAGPR